MSNPEVETFPEGVGRSRIAAGTLISVSCAERMCGEAGLMTCVMCPRRSLITSDIHCIETRLMPAAPPYKPVFEDSTPKKSISPEC